MTGKGPSADELTDGQVAEIGRRADEARMMLDEIVARDPSVAAAMRGLYADEIGECIAMVRDAYAAAGVSDGRARQASEAWFMVRLGVRRDLAFADELLADMAAGRLRRRAGLGAVPAASPWPVAPGGDGEHGGAGGEHGADHREGVGGGGGQDVDDGDAELPQVADEQGERGEQ